MAIFRIEKNKNYTTMSNYHLQDKDLSLKAKGLLSLMLSLPENWDYSVAGLKSICRESINTINSVLHELEKYNYLARNRVYANGKIVDWEYCIYEKPNLHLKNEDIENEDIENLDIENEEQLNTNKQNTKELNTNIIKKENIEKKKFIPPTLEEVQEYVRERNSVVDAKHFYDYFSVGNWKDSKGSPVKNWKQKIITWEKYAKDEKKSEETFEDILRRI